MTADIRSYNIGDSDYAKRKIQPWDIWLEYKLNPWDADIIKRVLRNKEGQEILDYQKIKHICDERIRQLEGEHPGVLQRKVPENASFAVSGDISNSPGPRGRDDATT